MIGFETQAALILGCRAYPVFSGSSIIPAAGRTPCKEIKPDTLFNLPQFIAILGALLTSVVDSTGSWESVHLLTPGCILHTGGFVHGSLSSETHFRTALLHHHPPA